MVRREQFLDQRDHLGNVACGAWHHVGPLAAECVKVFPERVDVLRGVLVDRQAGFLRLGDDAVFDVSDVHDMRDLVALELQVTDHDVSGDGAAEVSDVAVIPDGRTAVIEADLALAQRAKFFDATGQGIPKLEHGMMRIKEVRRIEQVRKRGLPPPLLGLDERGQAPLPDLFYSYWLKMLPAAGLQIPDARAFRNLDARVSLGDLADALDLNSIHSSWQARNVLRLHREQQLKIFTTMQRELERIERTTPAQLHDPLVNRQQRCINQRAGITRRAQMIEI